MYANGSCISTCQSLFYQRAEGTFNFCDYPCSSGLYLYANNSCLPTCQSKFSSRVEGANKFCDFTCSSSQYMFTNGSCISTCAPGLVTRIEGPFSFCDYPCLTGKFLYQNSSCLSTCNVVFNKRIEGAYKYCDFPCSQGKILYQNGSCLSSCELPFQPKSDGSLKFCTTICPSLNYSYYPDKEICLQEDCAPPYYSPQKGLCLQPPNQILPNVVSISRKILGISSIVATVASPANPIFFFGSALGKMPYYTRYMDLDYSQDLRGVFGQQQADDICPSIFLTIRDTVKRKMDRERSLDVSEPYLVSSRFIVNFLPSLLVLVLALSFGLYSWGLTFVVKNKESTFAKVVNKVTYIARWNFFFSFSVNFYDALVFYTALELKAHHSKGTLSIFSIIMCALMNIGFLFMVGWASRIIHKIRKTRVLAQAQAKKPNELQSMNDEKYKSYHIVYKSFDDSSLFQQAFFIIYGLRIYLYYIIIAYIESSSSVQAFLMMVLNIAMLAALFVKRPLKSQIAQVQYITQELLLLAINVLVLATADMSPRDVLSFRLRENIDNAIIALYIAFLLLSSTISIAQIVLSARDAYRAVRNRKFQAIKQEDKDDGKKPSKSIAELFQPKADLEVTASVPEKGPSQSRFYTLIRPNADGDQSVKSSTQTTPPSADSKQSRFFSLLRPHGPKSPTEDKNNPKAAKSSKETKSRNDPETSPNQAITQERANIRSALRSHFAAPSTNDPVKSSSPIEADETTATGKKYRNKFEDMSQSLRLTEKPRMTRIKNMEEDL